ncbi:four helix bundle protein [Chthonomonas sp.]|uniref:four helix bundle protein n=1 Tax=Chthonomonas sp. TaxID=2282153 RepID=UPI002B4B7280|nr:four helix bundle protein [Chthonomonas sp.]
MAKIASHKELTVWNNAMDAAMKIFEMTKSFPVEEKYSMVDQMRRSSRSVAANLAEAWRRRRYEAAFTAKLNDAEAEATEVQTWIELAQRCGYIDQETATELDETYEHIIGQIVTMIRQPGKWTLDRRSGGER